MTGPLDPNTIGFRIVTKAPKAPRDLIDAYAECPTTDIADVVSKMFTMSTRIRPLYMPIRRTAGSALTVRLPPGDNLMFHAAIDMVTEDQLIVVDARGDTEYALGGALLCGVAQSKGCRGVVLDGVYRDAYELKKIDFPVFGLGLQPKPPRKLGPGEVNTVISCGGVPVHPGDIVVADEEGVVVVPLEYAAVVLEKVRGRGKTDSGRWGDLSAWAAQHKASFDKVLADLKCRIE